MSSSSSWESDIRAREEQARAVFLAADIGALNELLADGYVVNSPLQRVVTKQQLFELIGTGRIRHSAYRSEIDHIVRHGDTVIVMGHDTVADPPDGVISRRRYTNVWQLDGDAWRSIARHAHVTSREPAE
jgi:ketosteroid isomerase-like protein